MGSKSNIGVEMQRKYYTDTAWRYEQMHEHEGAGDVIGTKFVVSILRMIDARSVLDVGTATGRGLKDLKEALPNGFVCGIEPVAALLEQAVQKGNTAGGPVVQWTGASMWCANSPCFITLRIRMPS